jgi:hypothetical protein
MSGSEDGGIKDQYEALKFAHERKIPLFIHSELNTQFQGSYPVFSIDDSCNIKIERKGFNDELILEKVNRIFNNL